MNSIYIVREVARGYIIFNASLQYSKFFLASVDICHKLKLALKLIMRLKVRRIRIELLLLMEDETRKNRKQRWKIVN